MARKLTEERAAEHGITEKPGHNGPSHDDIRMAVHEQLAWNQKRKALNDQISTFRKGLKAKGITLGVLDDGVRMLEWTPEEVKAHFAERNWYAEAMRFPIGSQLEFFGTDATPDAVKEQLKWRNIGVRDGLAGKGWPDQAPNGCPPDCVQAYGEGHEEGAETVRRAFAEKRKTVQPLGPELAPDAEADKADDWAEPTADETTFDTSAAA